MINIMNNIINTLKEQTSSLDPGLTLRVINTSNPADIARTTAIHITLGSLDDINRNPS